jgi:hypothetical protein
MPASPPAIAAATPEAVAESMTPRARSWLTCARRSSVASAGPVEATLGKVIWQSPLKNAPAGPSRLTAPSCSSNLWGGNRCCVPARRRGHDGPQTAGSGVRGDAGLSVVATGRLGRRLRILQPSCGGVRRPCVYALRGWPVPVIEHTAPRWLTDIHIGQSQAYLWIAFRHRTLSRNCARRRPRANLSPAMVAPRS